MPSMYQNQLKSMSDEEILKEYELWLRDLDRLTGGRADEAFMKANSLRSAWIEANGRGLDEKRQAIADQVRQERSEKEVQELKQMIPFIPKLPVS